MPLAEPDDRVCQAVSPDGQPCDFAATVHCDQCNRWFCDQHAEDEEWHACVMASGEEGGEA